MVDSATVQAQMLDVLQSARMSGGLQMSVEDEPFLVLNPGYHDGKRASFLLLPSAFCNARLFKPIGIARQSVVTSPMGRLLAVTDRAVVLTIITTTHLMAQVSCEITADLRSAGVETLGSLDASSRVEGWIVSWDDFDAVMADVARRFGLVIKHSLLMKLPPGSATAKGGNS